MFPFFQPKKCYLRTHTRTHKQAWWFRFSWHLPNLESYTLYFCWAISLWKCTIFDVWGLLPLLLVQMVWFSLPIFPVIWCWYIPSEKIGQNIDPLRNSFFVANYQHWTSTSALEPFLGPLDPWGALGGPWVVWGGLTTPKLPFSFEDQFKPWNGLFWLITTSYTMFLRFWVKMGPSGPKKCSFWPK